MRKFLLIPIVLSGCASVQMPDLSDSRHEFNQPVPVAEIAKWKAASAQLGTLLENAHRTSPTLAAAYAKSKQAKAAIGTSTAGMLPAINGTAGRNSSGENRRDTSTVIDTTGIAASWDIDVSGKKLNEREARLMDEKARAFDILNARITLSADVSDTFVSLKTCRTVEKNLSDDVSSRRNSLDYTSKRVEAGIAAPQDIQRPTSNLSDSISSLEAKKIECEALQTKLVMLTGTQAAEVSSLISEAVLPDSFEFIPSSIPADALRQRPDIMSAEKSVMSAYHDAVSASRAAYPSLSLSGTLGTGISTINGISSLVKPWTFLLSAAVPIFDAGAVRERTNSAVGKMDDAYATFVSKVRQAAKETEDAMTAFAGQSARSEQSGKTTAAFETSLNAIQTRFNAGIASRDDVEDAKRNLNAAKNAELATNMQKLSAQIAIYRATGNTGEEK